MSALALSSALDLAVSLAVVAAAATWLGVRAWRLLVAEARRGDCACPSAPTCGSGKGPSAADLRAAAARAAERLNRTTPDRR